MSIRFSELPGLANALQFGLSHIKVVKIPNWNPSDVKIGDSIYKIWDLDHYHGVVSTIVPRTRRQVVRDIRNAILQSKFDICDQDRTQNGQYVSDWIVLERHALCICSLRQGGIGAVLYPRLDFLDARLRWEGEMPTVEKQKRLKAQALAKLTEEEKRALGY